MKRNASFAASILTVLVLCTVSAAFGQRPQRDPEQAADRMVAAMKDRLKLTDDQATKVKPILVDSMKKQAEIFQKHNVTPGEPPSDEARAEMKAAREETDKKLAEVLTKEPDGGIPEDGPARARRTRRRRAREETVTRCGRCTSVTSG